MPLFDFKCNKCNIVEEKLIFNEKEIICEKCGEKMKQILSGRRQFILKGDCWEKDGYTKGKKEKKSNTEK